MHFTIYDFTEESDKFLYHELFISVKYDCNESNLSLTKFSKLLESSFCLRKKYFLLLDIENIFDQKSFLQFNRNIIYQLTCNCSSENTRTKENNGKILMSGLKNFVIYVKRARKLQAKL